MNTENKGQNYYMLVIVDWCPYFGILLQQDLKLSKWVFVLCGERPANENLYVPWLSVL